MNELTRLDRDLSVIAGLGLARQPVGVKFLYDRPQGVARLDGRLALCGMISEAASGRVFYAGLDNHECAGPVVLGMVDLDPFYRSGQIGPELQVFKEARANRRVYETLPVLARGTCNYLVLASLDRLAFDPDVLVLSGAARQMEIVLRSWSYTTGRPYESKGTAVMGCAWTLVYPYLTGRLNFSVTGLTFGHIAREVAGEGEVVVSIPWDCLPTMVENLRGMDHVLPAYTEGRDSYNERFQRIVRGTDVTAAFPSGPARGLEYGPTEGGDGCRS